MTTIREKVIRLEKTLENKSGNILIKVAEIEGAIKEDGMNIVEAIHLWDKNKSGCVIGFWEIRRQDNVQWIAEFREVQNILTETKFDEGVLAKTFYWGRRIADTIIDFYFNL